MRWRRPDGVAVGALAVDDEPEVFWDGADAADRIATWQAAGKWRDEWGTVYCTKTGTGSQGRRIADVYRPFARPAWWRSYHLDGAGDERKDLETAGDPTCSTNEPGAPSSVTSSSS